MKIQRVLSYILLGLAIIISIAFAFIELRSTFAGDFLLMNDTAKSFVGYVARSLFYLAMLTNVILVLINKIMKKRTQYYVLVLSSALVAGSIPLFFFYLFYIGLAVFVINVLVAAIALVRISSYETKDVE